MATGLLLVSFAPLVANAGASGPTPLDTPVDMVSDGFEGPSLDANWTVEDTDATNGTDTWGVSTARANTGTGSAWAAGQGNRTSNVVTELLNESFEGSVSAWNSEDRNATNGNDTWGASTARFHSGSTSMWSAQVGFNDEAGTDTNVNLGQYDSAMDSILWIDVTSSPDVRLQLSYWFYLDSEWFFDYLYVGVYDGSTWTLVDGHTGPLFGTPSWQQSNVSLPPSVTRVGFVFQSDSTGVAEGAYVDDVVITTHEITQLFTEDFENPLGPEWTLEDTDSASGADYWGRSQVRANGGSWSLYSAQVGFNNETGTDTNANLSLYDNDMEAIAWRAVDLGNFTDALVEFSFWIDSEASYDTLTVTYYRAGFWWTATGASFSGDTGVTDGWQFASVSVPTTATRVGVRFSADFSNVAEGAYVDDLSLIGIPYVQTNLDLGVYDGGMNSTMVRSIQMGPLTSATMEFSYWLDSTAPDDYFEAVYRTNGTWYSSNRTSGNSGGWQSVSVALAQGTTDVGVRFASTALGTLEGAYVDDFRVWAIAPQLNCTSGASATTSIEGQTAVDFTGGASDGIGPYTYEWDFGDGSSSSTQDPSHTYQEAGDYMAQLTARDSIGQACTPAALTVTVGHDYSVISVSPDAPDVVEGETVVLGALDAAGHPADANWSTDCGQVAPATGNQTTFTAPPDGGHYCTVTATRGAASGTAGVAVHYDTSSMSIVYSGPPLVANGTGLYQMLDANGYAVNAGWSVSPAGCGAFANAQTKNAYFTADPSAGGSICTITGTYPGVTRNAVAFVSFNLSEATVVPSEASVVEGENLSFAFQDTFGTPAPVGWTIYPDTCGQVGVTPGNSSNMTNVTFSGSAAGMTCMVNATIGVANWTANVTVLHGAPVSISMSPGDMDVVEGATQVFDAALADTLGHNLDASGVEWTTDCGSLTPSEGASTTVTVAADAGGTTCQVTATSGSISASATLTVAHEGPFAVAMSKATLALEGGASSSLTVSVKDARNHTIDGPTFVWSASCGELSSTAGEAVTFTAPGEAGNCTVTVQATWGTESVSSGSTTVTVTVPPPTGEEGGGLDTMLLLGIVLLVVVVGAAGAFLMMRSRGGKGGSSEPPASGKGESGKGESGKGESGKEVTGKEVSGKAPKGDSGKGGKK